MLIWNSRYPTGLKVSVTVTIVSTSPELPGVILILSPAASAILISAGYLILECVRARKL